MPHVGAAETTRRLPWLPVGLISLAALAHELLLTRLFALLHWSHFVALVISLALLGYGASGTLLTLVRERALPRFERWFAFNAVLFALAAPVVVLLVQKLPVDPLELPWDSRQVGYLMVMILLLALPFLAAANCIGLALSRYPQRVHRLYAADLLGAAVGVSLVVAALFWLHPAQALWLAPVPALLAALLVLERRSTRLALAFGAGLVAASIMLLPASWRTLQSAPYKDLAQALAVVGAEVEAERVGPLGVVQVLDNRQIPFRFAPGLSLATPSPLPAQKALFIDGDSAGAIIQFAGAAAPEYLDYLSSALPYHVLQSPTRVLVLGAGGGAPVLQALGAGASRIHAVELNPAIVALVRDDYREFTGELYGRPEVTLHIAEARRFLEASDDHYDVVQLDLLDAFAGGGLHAQAESYLYTVEAMQSAVRRLTPHGMLAITRWLRLPPRDSLKLLATAREALVEQGVTDPARHLALIRGWKTTTLLVARAPLRAEQLAAIRRFCSERSFDLAFLPDIRADELNRFNRLEQSYFHDGAQALLAGGASGFFDNYVFDVRPATDDRPFFFRFSRWHSLPDLLQLPGRGGLAQLDWGYLYLVLTLGIAAVLAVVLILLPLHWLARSGALVHRAPWRTVVYFAGIGLGFMFIEIAFIQKLQLFLGHPVYATAVALIGFLLFSGVGSYLSRRLQPLGRWMPVCAVGLVVVIVLVYQLLAPMLLRAQMPSPYATRLLLALTLIAPLAVAMGMPFPSGLRVLAGRAPKQIPWAWGVNGAASVVGGLAAAVLAMEFGFSGVLLLAAAAYATAGLVASLRPVTSLNGPG